MNSCFYFSIFKIFLDKFEERFAIAMNRLDNVSFMMNKNKRVEFTVHRHTLYLLPCMTLQASELHAPSCRNSRKLPFQFHVVASSSSCDT